MNMPFTASAWWLQEKMVGNTDSKNPYDQSADLVTKDVTI